MTKEFDKQFPSLVKLPDVIKCGAVTLQDIQKYCLDKSLVEKTIDEFVKEYSGLPVCINLTNELKQKLGIK